MSVKTVCLGAAGIAAFVGISYFNYRRFIPASESLGSEAYRVKVQPLQVAVNGHTLYGELLLPEGRNGKLPTVICSHGFASSGRFCKIEVGKSLAKSGYAVVCYDFYGGNNRSSSGGTLMDMSVFTEAEDLKAMIKAVLALPTTDPERFFLLGESQGGFVSSMVAAELNDKIRGLVLYYPAFCIPNDARKRFSSLNEVPERVKCFGHKVSRLYYEKLLDFDIYEELPQIGCPVLILHGDADRTVPVSYSRSAKKCIPDARLIELPKEDHGFSAAGKRTAAKETYVFLQGCMSRK